MCVTVLSPLSLGSPRHPVHRPQPESSPPTPSQSPAAFHPSGPSVTQLPPVCGAGVRLSPALPRPPSAPGGTEPVSGITRRGPQLARGSTGTSPHSGSESCGGPGCSPRHGERRARRQGGGGTHAELGLACGGSWGCPFPLPRAPGASVPHPEPGGGGPMALPPPPEAPRPGAASRGPHGPCLSLSLSLSPALPPIRTLLPAPQVPLTLSLPFSVLSRPSVFGEEVADPEGRTQVKADRAESPCVDAAPDTLVRRSV